MTWLELLNFGVGSDRWTNSATTTAGQKYFYPQTDSLKLVLSVPKLQLPGTNFYLNYIVFWIVKSFCQFHGDHF